VVLQGAMLLKYYCLSFFAPRLFSSSS
jgi:hypothetical protein